MRMATSLRLAARGHSNRAANTNTTSIEYYVVHDDAANALRKGYACICGRAPRGPVVSCRHVTRVRSDASRVVSRDGRRAALSTRTEKTQGIECNGCRVCMIHFLCGALSTRTRSRMTVILYSPRRAHSVYRIIASCSSEPHLSVINYLYRLSFTWAARIKKYSRT